MLKNQNKFWTRAHFLEKSKPSFLSTFLKSNSYVTHLMISLHALTMSRPSRALFLYILYCKNVHMYSSTVICTALLNLLRLYFVALPIRTVIGPVTVICFALLNAWHLYFTALFFLTVIEPIATARTQFITPKNILHVRLITEVRRINRALYLDFISDSVSKKILGDHLLTRTIAVLSNPAVKCISSFIFYFLGYLTVLGLPASLSFSF